jgi:phage gp36-like protein
VASYCTPEQLTRYGIRAEALRSIDPSDLQAACDAASKTIDGYLRSRYKLPLVAWGEDITLIAARMAVYQLVVVRGFNSARAGDDQIEKQYDVSLSTLKDIPTGRYNPDVTDASSGAEAGVSAPAGTAQVFSDSSRGWFSDSRGTGRRMPFQGGRG